ncbi:HAD-like domain-containing protein [Suillus subluteus]|nr:HAD-like domain-containing protein [Suillus subluteus]
MSQESPLSEPVIYYGKKFIVLSDWDGTITTQDPMIYYNSVVTDTFGMGRTDRFALNQRIRNGEDNFRDAFRKMIVSVVENGKEEGKVKHTFEFCKNAVANNIKVDDTFKGFYEFCGTIDIPVVIVSSWDLQYRHPESGFGHDKSKRLPHTGICNPPRCILLRDGVSDLSAARGATCLFIKHRLFQSFEEAQGVMKLIIFAETEEEQQNIIAREWPEVA